MTDVAVSVADYLKATALFAAVATPSAVAWGDRGVESEIISPLWDKAGAEAEGARQAAFLAGPLVEEVARVPGLRRDLMLKTVTISGDRLGYAAGATVFVIGFSELETNETELIVLRALS